MTFEVKIQFGKSNSIYYKEVLSLASKFTVFIPLHKDEPNTITVNQDTIEKDLEFIEPLWQLLCRWKSTRLFINDKLKTGLDAQKAMAPVICYCQYQKAAIQAIHCRSERQLTGWSCKLLTNIEYHTSRHLHHREQIYWYHCGYFITDDVWKIDKRAVIDILKREVEARCLYLCPRFDWQAVLQKITELPDEIDLAETNCWEKFYLEEPGLESKLIGVKPKTTVDEFTMD